MKLFIELQKFFQQQEKHKSNNNQARFDVSNKK